ncbi:chaperonin 10-like protein [Coniochaeta sp. 2T2.1]|nr:chaperonin 10-like protein [Coniochaeta sp. 2T2.1]
MGATTDLRGSKTTQRAQQYDQRDGKLHLNEIPIPTPKPNELLIKVACASLCHSDVMMFEPNDQGLILGQNPVTLGHEATGFVVEAGSESSGFKPGDKVGFLPAMDCCFDCHQCKNVHNLYCKTGKVNMAGFGVNGYFQEYAIVDARAAMVLPEELDVYTSAPLFCAGVTAFHGVVDADLKPGQWAAIVGCGGLGHLAIAYAKAMGYKVIGLDVVDSQLEEAKDQGADYVFNSATDKDYVKKIQELTGGGVDAAINYTASKRAYDGCPAIIRPGEGKLVVVGIPQQPLTLNALDIAMGRYRVIGSNNGTNYNMRPCIEFSAKHNIKPHLTLYKLEELPKMIELMHDGKARGRLGVKFD